MNDLINQKEQIWNTRLKECIDNAGYSQQAFATAFNKKYGTSCTQKSISRWINVGQKQSNNIKIGFPSYENMVKIADFFEKSVSYFTGETDYDSIQLEEISDYLNLTQSTVKELRAIANPNILHSKAWRIGINTKSVLESLITSDNFIEFISCLCALHECYSGPDKNKQLINELNKKYDKTILDKALELIDNPSDIIDDVDEEVISAIKEINHVTDLMYGNDLQKQYDNDVLKYRVQNAFTSLINNIFPE